MDKLNGRHLKAVSETALIPLFYLAQESQRSDAIVRDELAADLIEQIDYNFSAFDPDAPDRVFAMMRKRHFDRSTREFLAEHPHAIVVDIGCGLDTRFERLDSGSMEWYGVDFAEVIELRRRLLQETTRNHFLAYSALDYAWMDHLCARLPSPLLFLAEGVLPYLREGQVRMLIGALTERFPRCELIFDGMSPIFVWLHNRQALLKRFNLRVEWGVRNPRDLEKWASSIRLVSTWAYFDEPEPRLGRYAWLGYVPYLRHANWVARYRLGDARGEIS